MANIKRLFIGLLVAAIASIFCYDSGGGNAKKSTRVDVETIQFAVIKHETVTFDFTPTIITLPYSVGFTKVPTSKAEGFKGESINDRLKIPIRQC